jgi:hypothetical protein
VAAKKEDDMAGGERWRSTSIIVACVTLMVGCDALGFGDDAGDRGRRPLDPVLVAEGRQIFRHDTFGNETYWTDTLRLNEAVETVDPVTALTVGLKVDADAVPPEVLANADLTDPATTVALLSMDAVIGVRAQVDGGKITRLGITCALCHSTVDNSVMEGVGRRLDGWPNRDLDVGAIVALSPALDDATKAVLQSWGPGRYDAYLSHDGQSSPVLLPPAYGLRHVELETYTGEGPVSYWNAYVAVTQMHGRGSFSDPRLGINIVHDPDLVTSKLPALAEYQFSLEPPAPPAGSVDAAAVGRGGAVFRTVGECTRCHIPNREFTDAGIRLHAPEETGMEPVRASRGTTGAYRTTPLRGVWHRAPYFHDGSAATLEQVVEHYDTTLNLGLTAQQKSDLAAYLRSL